MMLRSDLKIALRSFWRNRLYTILNFAGLSVGLTASVLILLWVQNERSFDTIYKNSGQIYRVTNTLIKQDPPWIWSNSPYLLGSVVKEQIPGVEKVTRLSTNVQNNIFRVGDQLFEEKKVGVVDSSWFDVFSYTFVSGSKSAILEPNSMILTQTEAKKWFGDNEPVGKIVRIDTTDFTVGGVVTDNPANSSFQYEVILPVASRFRDESFRKNSSNWNNFNVQVFLQLKKGTSTKTVDKQINRLYVENKKDSSIVASLIPLTEIHFNNTFQNDSLPKGNTQTVTTMGIIGILILIIASINFVNLTTALASKRAKEVGLKKMIGADRFNLFVQFLAESLLQIFAAALGAVIFIKLLLPVFNGFTEKHFSLEWNNTTLWLLVIGSGLGTFLVAGIYPAILLSALKPVNLVKGERSRNSFTAYFRQGLVVLQFAISILLVIGTLGIDRQLEFVKSKNPGYSREHIFSFRLGPAANRQVQLNDGHYLKQQIGALASVKGVESINESVVAIGNSQSGSLSWKGKAEDFNPTLTVMSVGNRIPALLGLKLKEGRWLDEKFKTDTANIVLNETAVKALGFKMPVAGKSVNFQGMNGKIVGVAKDFHFRSFHQKITPLIMCNDPAWQGEILVKVNGADASAVLGQVGKIWRDRYPDNPFKYEFLDEQYNKLYKDEQKAAQLFKSFAAIAIIISCLGLFGLATFTAQNRIKEIGIRKVLGSTVFGIVALLSKDFVKVVMIAMLIAIPAGNFFIGKWLEDFEYRTEMEWWIFALAGMSAIVIALVTVSFQSIRAALMNPVSTLKSE